MTKTTTTTTTTSTKTTTKMTLLNSKLKLLLSLSVAAIALCSKSSSAFVVHVNVNGNPRLPHRSSTSLAYDKQGKTSREEPGDWREFRAKLVLQEHGIDRATPDQHQQWAYRQDLLEAGAILVHDAAAQPFLDRPYLFKSVVLILDVGTEETTALILNRLANITLHEPHFTATLFYGGRHDSFHDPPKQRIFCLHRNSDPQVMEASKEVMSGLYLCSLEDAKKVQAQGRAQPADFLYISGYETFKTDELAQGITDGTFKSITIDGLTMQHALYQGADIDAVLRNNDVHTNLLTMIGLTPPPVDEECDTARMQAALLQEWKHTALNHGPAPVIRYAQPPPHNICEGDLLRASSLDHAFLFDHLEFHKSLVLVLEANEEMAVAALLSYPSAETCPELYDLPIRYGGSDGSQQTAYALHHRGPEAVPGSVQIGKSPYFKCTVEEAALALEHGHAHVTDFLVVRGKRVFPRVNAALEFVKPQASFAIWDILGHQQPLSPFTLDAAVEISRDAWRIAGGQEGKEELSQLGQAATKAWVHSHLLKDKKDKNDPSGGSLLP